MPNTNFQLRVNYVQPLKITLISLLSGVIPTKHSEYPTLMISTELPFLGKEALEMFGRNQVIDSRWWAETLHWIPSSIPISSKDIPYKF